MSEDLATLAAAHRPRLIALARAVLRNRDDAEDIASEAISRALVADVSPECLGGWLMTTTKRLIVDEVRVRDRRRSLVWRLSAYAESVAPDETELRLDQAEAEWLATVVAALPPRQRAVVEALVACEDISSVADSLGISYRAAENLLLRARRTVRASARSSWAWLVAIMSVRWARRSLAAAPVTVALSAAVVLLVHTQTTGPALAGPPSVTPIVAGALPDTSHDVQLHRSVPSASHTSLPTDIRFVHVKPGRRVERRTVFETKPVGKPGGLIYVGTIKGTEGGGSPGEPDGFIAEVYGCAQHPYVMAGGWYTGCWPPPEGESPAGAPTPTPVYNGILPDLPS